MIMGRVLDTLYGSNLDSDTPQDIFKVASDVSLVEHQILEAQRSFPPSLQPVELSDLEQETRPPFLALRFRLVLTLRYHNLRILTHRPLLQRYLGVLRGQSEDGQQHVSSLDQVGPNSLHICMQSARTIVELLAHATKSKGEDKGLLGAWWFSLYYSKSFPSHENRFIDPDPCTMEKLTRVSFLAKVFNAALVIYSGLLIRDYADDRHWTFLPGDSEIGRHLLYRAVDSLMALDMGNTRAEQCAQYILRLDRVLDSPCKYHPFPPSFSL
jgi:hypothetical protein